MASAEDTKHFNQLKERLADKLHPNHDDEIIWKFLRARRSNVDEAEKMYTKMLQWREENGVDTILRDFQLPEVIRKYYSGGISGYDKEGRPVWMDPIGRLDLRGIIGSVEAEDITKSLIYKLEDLYRRFKEISEEQGCVINQCVQIIDLDGFGFKHVWRPGLNMFIKLLKMLDSNYPETLFKTFIINAPYLFHKGFELIKAILSEDTKKKFIFLGHEYQTELLKYIDASELPKHWGGDKTDEDGDEYCSSLVCMGGDVPREFYLQNYDTTM